MTTVEVPQAPPVAYLYLCPGPCSTAFTTKVLATTSHYVSCDVPPHKGSSYSYYSCPPDNENICPAKALHQTICRGGCGTFFSDNTGTRPRGDDAHRTQCDEKTSRNIWNFWTGNCIGDYYSCNGQTSADCSNASEHISDDEDDDDSDDDDDDDDDDAEEQTKAKLLPCGHKEGSAGYHGKTNHRWCGHNDWYCLGAAGHNYVKCPRKADGDFCRTDPKYKGYHLPCDTSHVHTYLSDQPPEPKKQVTPTTTDPKPKQVLPKDSDDDDDDTPPSKPDPSPEDELRACGRHKKSVGGDHRFIHVCSETNSKGQSCERTSTGYWVCDPHTHKYPAVQKVLRQCGRHYKSEGGDHRYVSVCSATNSSGQSCTRTSVGYWVCDPHTHKYAAEMRQCGSHTKSEGGDHRYVSVCSETNSSGKSCERTSVGYWACKPHNHKYASD